MKQFFTKIIAATLAFLVLFSTFSFTVEKHYCGDFLIDVSYTGDVQVCNNDIASDLSIQIKKCCKDEVQKIEGQDELQITSLDKITFEKQQFLTAFLFAYQNLYIDNSPKNVFQKIFPPPETYQNYQVTYQSFLI